MIDSFLIVNIPFWNIGENVSEKLAFIYVYIADNKAELPDAETTLDSGDGGGGYRSSGFGTGEGNSYMLF